MRLLAGAAGSVCTLCSIGYNNADGMTLSLAVLTVLAHALTDIELKWLLRVSTSYPIRLVSCFALLIRVVS